MARRSRRRPGCRYRESPKCWDDSAPPQPALPVQNDAGARAQRRRIQAKSLAQPRGRDECLSRDTPLPFRQRPAGRRFHKDRVWCQRSAALVRVIIVCIVRRCDPHESRFLRLNNRVKQSAFSALFRKALHEQHGAPGSRRSLTLTWDCWRYESASCSRVVFSCHAIYGVLGNLDNCPTSSRVGAGKQKPETNFCECVST